MKTASLRCALAILLGSLAVHAGSDQAASSKEQRLLSAQPIDLATALRLAGANNLDVKIAGQRLAEAQANEHVAIEQFFPYLSTGVGLRRHEGNIQNVEGRIIDADKNLYNAGVGATAQVDLGDAIFRTLAARQLKQAAAFAAGAQKQESIFQAALAYFDLARAKAASGVASESVRIAQDYAAQIKQAVDAGLAFKGDLYRATTQAERNQLTASQALEQQRLAAARLAQILHLDPAIALTPVGGELTPLRLNSAKSSLETLTSEAIASRPELKQYAAQLLAARKSRHGAIYGPLIPSIGGQATYGALGGGVGNPGPNDFGQSSDYSAGLSWRIGPGGLFDAGRIQAQDARVRGGELELEKAHAEIVRQVVDGHTRIHALSQQITILKRALEAAEQALDLTRGRRQFAVGEVLENIQAEQEVTRARLDYVNIVAEHNKAQYALERARGGLQPAAPTAASKKRAPAR